MTGQYINKIYLDRYKIIEELPGNNDFELTFKGIDLQSNKSVFFRVIPADKEHPELREQSQRFIFKELSLLQRLHHDGLPAFLDSVSNKDENVIITDYREGVPLADKLQNKTPMGEQETLNFIEKLLPILKYLHTQSPPIIYRDLQPKSIFVDNTGNPFLTKYEAARVYKADKIKDTVVVSTRGYNPPEQALGKGQSDARSDIYSLGMVIFQMLTGKDPTASLILPSVSDIRKDISPIWAGLVTKATNIKPDKRYASIDDLSADLSRIKGSPIDTNKNTASQSHPVQRPVTVTPTVSGVFTASTTSKPSDTQTTLQKESAPTTVRKTPEPYAQKSVTSNKTIHKAPTTEAHDSWIPFVLAALIIITLTMLFLNFDKILDAVGIKSFLDLTTAHKTAVGTGSAILLLLSYIFLKPKY